MLGQNQVLGRSQMAGQEQELDAGQEPDAAGRSQVPARSQMQGRNQGPGRSQMPGKSQTPRTGTRYQAGARTRCRAGARCRAEAGKYDTVNLRSEDEEDGEEEREVDEPTVEVLSLKPSGKFISPFTEALKLASLTKSQSSTTLVRVLKCPCLVRQSYTLDTRGKRISDLVSDANINPRSSSRLAHQPILSPSSPPRPKCYQPSVLTTAFTKPKRDRRRPVRYGFNDSQGKV